MSPPSRRRTLSALGAALAGGLGGCSALTESETPRAMRVAEIAVTNYDDEPHDVQVLFTESGEPIWWRTMATEAHPGEPEGPGGGLLEGYPTDPGTYTIHARHEGLPADQWNQFDFETLADAYAGDASVVCVELKFRVGKPFEPNESPPEVNVWYSIGCNGDERTDA